MVRDIKLHRITRELNDKIDNLIKSIILSSVDEQRYSIHGNVLTSIFEKANIIEIYIDDFYDNTDVIASTEIDNYIIERVIKKMGKTGEYKLIIKRW